MLCVLIYNAGVQFHVTGNEANVSPGGMTCPPGWVGGWLDGVVGRSVGRSACKCTFPFRFDSIYTSIYVYTNVHNACYKHTNNDPRPLRVPLLFLQHMCVCKIPVHKTNLSSNWICTSYLLRRIYCFKNCTLLNVPTLHACSWLFVHHINTVIGMQPDTKFTQSMLRHMNWSNYNE